MITPNLITDSINGYQDGYFTVENISDNIISVTSEDGAAKYIIFDTPVIYQNTGLFIEYATEIRKEIPKSAEVLRIPHFAGCSGYDLGEFLLSTNGNIDIGLEILPEFSITPANFNTNGLRYFAEYLESIYIQRPVFKSNNKYTDYVAYIVDMVQANQWVSNMVIPADMLLLTPELKSIQEIFKEIDKAKESIKDN